MRPLDFSGGLTADVMAGAGAGASLGGYGLSMTALAAATGIGTPFGLPVVPEVNSRTNSASPPTAIAAAWGASGS